jgi:hypothetical protein
MATHAPVIEEYAHIYYELSDGQVKKHSPPRQIAYSSVIHHSLERGKS